MDKIYRKQIDHIKKLLTFFPVVGILGARQVGKTTLVKDLKTFIPKETIYIDLESDADLVKLTDPELYLSKHEEKCVIIDEIQRKKELFPLLRSLVDKNRKEARFIITGSASPELIRDSSESLAGRIAYVTLNPFHLDEIGIENMDQHWLRGGFPLSFLAKEHFFSWEWREQFVRTYIEKDLPILGLKVSYTNFRKFIGILAHANAQTINYSNIAKSMTLTIPTINKYIDFLDKAFLLIKLDPYYVNTKKRMVKSSKIYFSDCGILHSLLGIESMEILQSHLYLGASWETYVINQITSILKKEFKVFFYRTHNGAEVDLVIERGGIAQIAAEIKYTNAPKISKGNYLSFEDIRALENYIITPSSDFYEIKKGITVTSLPKFIDLLKEKKFTIWT